MLHYLFLEGRHMSQSGFEWKGRRAGDSAHERVASFLVMDIQRSPAWARELAEKVAEVRAGRLASWERIGNAYRLFLSHEGALLEDLVGPDSRPERVPLAEFEEAARAWLDAQESSGTEQARVSSGVPGSRTAGQ